MSRFYRNLTIIVAVIALTIYLFFRFIDSYTSTMSKTYSPFENTEEDS